MSRINLAIYPHRVSTGKTAKKYLYSVDIDKSGMKRHHKATPMNITKLEHYETLNPRLRMTFGPKLLVSLTVCFMFRKLVVYSRR